ncbi:Uncharacterised protein [Metamycoplasma cloacale]|uniref:Uncharacterized protein n=1 Tax=Metamycoplasma cloacale TaxID=92401 RepID=A0A2Z4LMD2_9BACT|nr:hypothetical protein [Metamycoplasma cloacale]AWX42935.1 hypothetical protein DK849_02600 [Metamycoplasma cloacale]VEU79241.1 Uncharacterised protein [Metamycoplasma cloacale]
MIGKKSKILWPLLSIVAGATTGAVIGVILSTKNSNNQKEKAVLNLNKTIEEARKILPLIIKNENRIKLENKIKEIVENPKNDFNKIDYFETKNIELKNVILEVKHAEKELTINTINMVKGNSKLIENIQKIEDLKNKYSFLWNVEGYNLDFYLDYMKKFRNVLFSNELTNIDIELMLKITNKYIEELENNISIATEKYINKLTIQKKELIWLEWNIEDSNDILRVSKTIKDIISLLDEKKPDIKSLVSLSDIADRILNSCLKYKYLHSKIYFYKKEISKLIDGEIYTLLNIIKRRQILNIEEETVLLDVINHIKSLFTEYRKPIFLFRLWQKTKEIKNIFSHIVEQNKINMNLIYIFKLDLISFQLESDYNRIDIKTDIQEKISNLKTTWFGVEGNSDILLNKLKEIVNSFDNFIITYNNSFDKEDVNKKIIDEIANISNLLNDSLDLPFYYSDLLKNLKTSLEEALNNDLKFKNESINLILDYSVFLNSEIVREMERDKEIKLMELNNLVVEGKTRLKFIDNSFYYEKLNKIISNIENYGTINLKTSDIDKWISILKNLLGNNWMFYPIMVKKLNEIIQQYELKTKVLKNYFMVDKVFQFSEQINIINNLLKNDVSDYEEFGKASEKVFEAWSIYLDEYNMFLKEKTKEILIKLGELVNKGKKILFTLSSNSYKLTLIKLIEKAEGYISKPEFLIFEYMELYKEFSSFIDRM